ncbi:MAG: DUF1476 domain-containing protein [Alphaproteobacteria bacterium]
MSSYDDRQKGFERKFAHDEEMQFKATARRNKLLGLWAADKLGKSGPDAEQYSKDVVMADFESSGHDDVIQKLLTDFTEANLPMSATDIRREMERLTPIAQQMVLEESKSA